MALSLSRLAPVGDQVSTPKATAAVHYAELSCDRDSPPASSRAGFAPPEDACVIQKLTSAKIDSRRPILPRIQAHHQNLIKTDPHRHGRHSRVQVAHPANSYLWCQWLRLRSSAGLCALTQYRLRDSKQQTQERLRDFERDAPCLIATTSTNTQISCPLRNCTSPLATMPT